MNELIVGLGVCFDYDAPKLSKHGYYLINIRLSWGLGA